MHTQHRHIYKLSGQKRVKFLPPFLVDYVKPDPDRKHWPGASKEELEKAFQYHGWTADLSPGDMLYIPLLWCVSNVYRKY